MRNLILPYEKRICIPKENKNKISIYFFFRSLEKIKERKIIVNPIKLNVLSNVLRLLKSKLE